MGRHRTSQHRHTKKKFSPISGEKAVGKARARVGGARVGKGLEERDVRGVRASPAFASVGLETSVFFSHR